MRTQQIQAILQTVLRRPLGTVVIIFLLSTCIVLVTNWITPSNFHWPEISDYVNYYEPVARNFIAGKGFIDRTGQLATAQGPGFPLLLSGLFQLAEITHISEGVILVGFTLFCTATTALILFLLYSNLWSTGIGVLLTVIWLTYPFSLWFTQNSNSETPFMVCFYAGILLLFQSYRIPRRRLQTSLLAGLAFGISALIRPIAIGIELIVFLIVLVAIPQLKASDRLRLAGGSLIGFLMPVLVWILLVYQITGQIIPIASSGERSSAGGVTYAISNPFDTSTVAPDILDLQRRILAKDPHSLGDIARELWTEFQDNPSLLIKFGLLKLARSWYGTYSGKYEIYAIFIQIPYLLFSLIGLWQSWRIRYLRPMLVLSLLVAAYFWGVSTLVVSNVRYMAPVMALIFMFIPGIWSRVNISQINSQSTGS